MSAGELSSLVGSVARLQLPLSAQLEDGITRRLDKVLTAASSDELQGLVAGLLLLEVQLPSPTLRALCAEVQPHLGSFKAAATCSLLQLLSREGEYPPSPVWMDAALAGLEPQLQTLEALPALQLLQSLKEFHTQPPPDFMVKLQARLVHLTKEFDAMGVATMVQGLVGCGVGPNLELQRGLARHIKKGLARPSQGMGGTPVWLLLGALLLASNRAQGTGSVRQHVGSVISRELLDELLSQVAAQLSAGAVSSSRLCYQLLPTLAAAFIPGGCWAPPGYSYVPSAGFCAALCGAMLELQCCDSTQLLSVDDGTGLEQQQQQHGLLWLGLLVRFGDMSGFKPPAAWVQAANKAVLISWAESALTDSSSSSVQQSVIPAAAAAAAVAGGWQVAPASQLAAWLSAVGRLHHAPTYLPGWPEQMLSRLQVLLGEMSGHELSVALLGLAHQQQLAEMAAAAAAGSSLPDSTAGSSSPSSMLAALATVKPQLLAAAEAASLRHLPTLDTDDLAILGHALQELEHTPAPVWISAWLEAVAAQLPGCSAVVAVLQLVALAGFSARPSAELLQGLVSRCQAGVGQLQLTELLGFARALLLLRFRPDAGLLQDLVKAGQAAAATAGVGAAAGTVQGQQAHQMQLLLQLRQVVATLAS